MRRLIEKTPKWFKYAACKGSSHLFFDAVFPARKDGTISQDADLDALARAREVCAGCPVRLDCLEWVMQAEAGAAAENRYGIAAMLTPQQRWSLEKRGTLRSECHAEVTDPVGHLTGQLQCPTCERETRTPVLPNSGDLWNRRHTELARRVGGWLLEDIPIGGPLPAPGRLADQWSVRRHDMVRVYQALVEDGTLEKRRNTEPPNYVRIGTTTPGSWMPLHLR